MARDLKKDSVMTKNNRLDTIATRQLQSRLRDRLFVVAVALVTCLTIGTVALG